jgi:arsenate reductase
LQSRERLGKQASMTPTLYGIPNCDTVRKARVWLDQHGVAFAFHDYKKASIDRPRLEAWVAEHGWETVLNRAGTTFRALPDADRANLDAGKAVALMLAQPSMIKRPVLDMGDRTVVGFKPERYAAILT